MPKLPLSFSRLYFRRDLRGQTFGTLSPTNYAGGGRWECICTCGNPHTAATSDLTSGNTKSCGCRRYTGFHGYNKKHGLSKHPIYAAWRAMWARCTNSKHASFDHYGERGIRVTARWKSFEKFYADVGPGYKPGLHLDRKDTDGPYCKRNVEWATPKKNNRHKTNARVIKTPLGTMPVWKAAELSGIANPVIWNRWNRGWPVARLLDPVRRSI